MARSAEHIRHQLLNALADCRTPVTTAELLERLHDRGEPASLTIEAVYRNLVLLQNHKQVRRVRTGGRHVSWKLTTRAQRARDAGGAA